MKLRVVAFVKSWRNNMHELEEEYWQHLQREEVIYDFKFLGIHFRKTRWVTIDKEHIPSSCVFQHNCLGSTDWKSKFRHIPNVEFIKHSKR